MDKSKILVIGLIVAVLLIVFLIIRSIFSDDTQPLFGEMLQAQSTLIELSDMAVDNGSSSATRINAASILSTTTTDYRQLQQVHQDRYGFSVNAVDSTAIEELEEARENFDEIYNQLASDYLEISIERLDFFANEIDDPDTLQAIKSTQSNQQTQLERIQQ